MRGVANGLLVQDADRPGTELESAKVVTQRQPTPAELAALRFGWKVVKHVKSNAIVFAAEAQTLAVGGGQTSRVEAIRNASARGARGIALAIGSRATPSSRSPTGSKRPRTPARPRSSSRAARRATKR
jgi:phosphoribosylaminoimidazolecarboxamide formyltransferase/IMP cyclohydrolase